MQYLKRLRPDVCIIRSGSIDRAIKRVVVTSLLGLGLFIAGCADIKIRTGQPIDPSGLELLEIGESTAADVSLALGAPFGQGRSFLPFQAEYTDLWSYYYEIGTLADDRRTFLFVFLNDGTYEGHMWFSSLPDAQR